MPSLVKLLGNTTPEVPLAAISLLERLACHGELHSILH